MAADLYASLRSWPIDGIINGHRYHLEPISAADWLAIILDDEWGWWDIFPGLADEDTQEAVGDMLILDEITAEQVTQIGVECLAIAAGRSAEHAQLLIHTANSIWDRIGGELALSGLDPNKISLAAWLDTIYYLLVRGSNFTMESKAKLDATLAGSAAKIGGKDTIDRDAQQAAFLALMEQP